MKHSMFGVAMTAAIVMTAAVPVRAQAVTGYTVRVYNQGAAQPVQAPTQFQAADFTCNQDAPAGTAGGTLVTNPSKILFDDPANAGKVCIWTDPGTGVLFSLPFGTTVYEATITALNSAGESPESVRSNPFGRPGTVAPAPTGLKFTRQ